MESINEVSDAMDMKRESSNKFLNFFWDLASDDITKRREATYNIVSYLQSVSQESGGKNCPDRDYSLKRLVRGLSSSRESARQGFATCLSEILRIYEEVDIDEILTAINETTKVTGSIKGHEERELIFGKLFGYLCIIRSGRINTKPIALSSVLDNLIELLFGKPWMKEAVIEAILSLISELSYEQFLKFANEKISTLFKDMNLLDLNYDHLKLLLGLLHYLQTVQGSIPDYLSTILEEIPGITSDIIQNFHTKSLIVYILPAFKPALIKACAGYPKIHSVWTFILSNIFELSKERALPSQRAKDLTSSQQNSMTELVSFIEDTLLVSSHEKRSVGVHLITEIVTRCPVDLLPLALTKKAVRCLLSSRKNKKHTLYNITGTALTTIVKSVETDSLGKLALASIIVQFGGANFDSYTSTTTISQLLDGLHYNAVSTHIRFLCGILASTVSSTSSNMEAEEVEVASKNKKSKKDDVKGLNTARNQATDMVVDDMTGEGGEGEEGNNDEEEEDDETALTTAKAAIDAMTAILRNSKLPQRGHIILTVIGILIRISYFGSGHFKIPDVSSENSAVEESGKKKKKKKADKKEINPVLVESRSMVPTDILETIKIVESSDEGVGYEEELRAYAGAKLLSILADYGHMSVTILNRPQQLSQENKPGKTAHETDKDDAAVAGSSLLESAVAVVTILCGCGLTFARDEVEGDDSGEGPCFHKLFSQIQDTRKTINGLAAKASDEVQSDTQQGGVLTKIQPLKKLCASLRSLLEQTFFFILSEESADSEVLENLISVLPKLLEASPPTPTNSEMDDEGEDAGGREETPQITFLDCTLELLSVPVDNVIKGVREALKRAWTSLGAAVPIEDDVLRLLGNVVAGEEDGDGDEEAAEGASEDGDDDETGSHSDADVEDTAGSEEEEEGEGDDDDGDGDSEKGEIMLSAHQAFKMLSVDDSDGGDGDGGAGLQHFEGADGALVEMLKQRRMTRKEGLKEALRSELVNRTRAAEILDVIINKYENTVPLLGLTMSLLRCVKKIQSSELMKNLAEGKALESKLCNLIETKISKKRFHSKEVDLVELVPALKSSLEEILPYLNYAGHSVRAATIQIFYGIFKAILHTEDSELTSKLADIVTKSYGLYSSKKASHLPSKFFEDLITRFPEFTTIHLLGHILDTTQSGKSEYLRINAYHLLSIILRRISNFPLAVQGLIVSKMNGLTDNMIQSLRIGISDVDSDGKDEGKSEGNGVTKLKSSHVKDILHYGKDLVAAIRILLPNHSKDLQIKSIESWSSKLAAIGSVAALTNPAHKQMFSQLLSSVQDLSNSKAKKEKKKKAVMDGVVTETTADKSSLKKTIGTGGKVENENQSDAPTTTIVVAKNSEIESDKVLNGKEASCLKAKTKKGDKTKRKNEHTSSNFGEIHEGKDTSGIEVVHSSTIKSNESLSSEAEAVNVSSSVNMDIDENPSKKQKTSKVGDVPTKSKKVNSKK